MINGILHPLVHIGVQNLECAVGISCHRPILSFCGRGIDVEVIVSTLLIQIAAIALHDGVTTVSRRKHEVVSLIIHLYDAVDIFDINYIKPTVFVLGRHRLSSLALGNNQVRLATLDGGSLLILTLACGLWVRIGIGIGCGTALDSYEVGIQHLVLVFFLVVTTSADNRQGATILDALGSNKLLELLLRTILF